MRFLIRSAIKDLRWRLADPSALLIWIGIPFVLGGLLGLMAGSDAPAPQAHVLLVDEDDTFLSNLLANAQPPGDDGLLRIEKVALDDGRARINAGTATALLIIPKGFTEGILEEKPTKLVLYTNPSQTILPKIVEQFLEIIVEGVFYLQRMMGDTLREISAGPPKGEPTLPDATVAAMSVKINQLVSRLKGTLLPPLIQVENVVVAQKKAASDLGFGIIFLPGILFMSLIFISQGISDDIWKEKDQGTLRRIVSSPQSLSLFLLGKLAAGAAFMLVVSLAGLAIGAAAFRLAPGRMPLALIWCTFAGTVMLSFFLFIQSFATSRRAGALLTMIIVFPLIMLGGSFFPFEAMPDWMARIGRWTPNGMAVSRLKELLAGEGELLSLLKSAAGIALPSVIALFWTVRRLRGRFLTG